MSVIVFAQRPRPNYADIADTILDLPNLLEDTRARLGITTTIQAKQLGIAKSTLTNLTGGVSTPTQTTIVAALRWLAQHA